MAVPRLKRIKVSSQDDLRSWLAKNSAVQQQVMIVTCNKKSPKKHLSSDQVRSVLTDLGWTAGQSYTLDGNLVGHVAKNI